LSDEGEKWEEDTTSNWNENLRVNLPSLDFRIRYSDGKTSENLFENDLPDTQMNMVTDTDTVTGGWTAPKPIEKVLEEGMTEDPAGGNPFMIYALPSLPEEGAIPIYNLAKALNEGFGGKDLFFEYEVNLTSIPEEDGGDGKGGEILLYPAMFEKKIAVSVDMLIIVPLVFQADSKAEGPIVMIIDPDVDEDLFQRSSVNDNEYFDMVTSFGFNANIKNAAGLSAGQVFLETKTTVSDDAGGEKPEYELFLFDFAEPRKNLSLDSAELENIKKIWPFIPQASIRFEPGAMVRIERGFNIELQSVSVRAGGEYTFETGL
jgi:hypothetical protein